MLSMTGAYMSTTTSKPIADWDVLGLFVHPVLPLPGLSQRKLTFTLGGLPEEHLLYSLNCDGKLITSDVLATAPLKYTRGNKQELLLTPEPAKPDFPPIAITKTTPRLEEINAWLSNLYHRHCTLQAMNAPLPVRLALLSAASLRTVNAALTVPLTAEALAANLVVETETAFAEASWTDTITIEKVQFSVGEAIAYPQILVEQMPWKDDLDSAQHSLRDYLTAADGTLVLGRFLSTTKEGAITNL